MRQKNFDFKQGKIQNLRKERLERENVRFARMDAHKKFESDRIVVKRDTYNASKKNKGGSAFNIINLGYDQNNDGMKLASIDNDAKVRALMRSKVLDKKNNG